MEFVNLKNGETLAYERVGEGENILLCIHGNFSSHKHYRRLMNNVPDGWTLIVPDLRGFGDSTYNTRITCLKDFAEDLNEMLDVLGIAKCAVLGWSLGGGVAMELAVLAPEKVTKLFLQNPTSCYGYPLLNQLPSGAYVPFKSPEDLGNNIAIAALLSAQRSGMDRLYRNTVHLPFYDKEEEDEFISTFMVQRNLLDADWALAVFNMTDRPSIYSDGTNTAKDIVCPITITAGDRDHMVTFAMLQQNLEAFLGKAKLIMYKDCGHSPIIEKTEEFLKDLNEFLAS